MVKHMSSPKITCKLYNSIAQLYCECLAIEKANEYSQMAETLSTDESDAKLHFLHLKMKIYRIRVM